MVWLGSLEQVLKWSWLRVVRGRVATNRLSTPSSLITAMTMGTEQRTFGPPPVSPCRCPSSRCGAACRHRRHRCYSYSCSSRNGGVRLLLLLLLLLLGCTTTTNCFHIRYGSTAFPVHYRSRNYYYNYNNPSFGMLQRVVVGKANKQGQQQGQPEPQLRAPQATISKRTSVTATFATTRTSASATTNREENTESLCLTREQIQALAEEQGVLLSLSTLGPAYRAVARAKHNTTMILGYIEGFIRPTATITTGSKFILHLDKMIMYKELVQRTRIENPNQFKGGGSILGVGLWLAYLCVCHGIEQGCSVGEFLAIDDSDIQHERLVRLYQVSGFDVIKYVGDSIQDIPDRMVWGGCGTLFRQDDLSLLLSKWTRIMQKNRASKSALSLLPQEQE